MSEFNPSVAKQKLPAAIDKILAEHKKMLDACDAIEAASKATGAVQAVEDAKAIRTVFESLNDLAVRMCGQEGDTAADNGSFWSIVEAAKKIEIATGGAI